MDIDIIIIRKIYITVTMMYYCNIINNIYVVDITIFNQIFNGSKCLIGSITYS